MGKNKIKRFYIFSAVFFLAWSLLILYSSQREIAAEREKTISMARNEAITTFNKDQSLRYWSAEHGGVYVPVSEKTAPNPFLGHLPHRDVRTDSGQILTLMNPAYMIRQIMSDYEKMYGIKGHITSLKPLNPTNFPDPWERKALETFEKTGAQEVFEVEGHGEKAYVRLMRPMITEKGCLKCHGFQGYTIGQVRGGVGVKVAMADYRAMERETVGRIATNHMFFWVVGSVALLVFVVLGKRNIEKEMFFTGQLEVSNSELNKALSEIKTLRGVIPICSCCKKIRDDQGGWNQLEAYIRSHSEAEFSHGLCPDCFEEQMKEME
jgi:hypothetical protein